MSKKNLKASKQSKGHSPGDEIPEQAEYSVAAPEPEGDEATALLVAHSNLQEPQIAVFRPDRAGVRKVLGDLEADIMEYIWEQTARSAPAGANTTNGLTVRQVYEAFRVERVIAYTTVMSTMNRLAHKNLLTIKRQGADTAYYYTPTLTKAAFIDNFVGRILENLLVSFSDSAETQLEKLTTAENATRLAALKDQVAGWRNRLHSAASPTSEPAGSPTANRGDRLAEE